MRKPLRDDMTQCPYGSLATTTTTEASSDEETPSTLATAGSHDCRSTPNPSSHLGNGSQRLLLTDYFVMKQRSVTCSETEGTASIPAEVANMVKNIIGGAVLSFSSGIAMFADDPKAAIAACLCVACLGAICGYFCLLISKVSDLVSCFTYSDMWQKTVGGRLSPFIPCSTAITAALINLAYASILTETFQSLLLTVGIKASRTISLLIISVFALLPLCLLKNINVLAPFSTIGVACITLTAILLLWRYFDGSYQEGGVYHSEASFEPKFGHRNDLWSFSLLPFLCIIMESFLMHFNSPRFYAELSHRSVTRYAIVVGFSFGISAILEMTIGAAGFLTFGGSSESYILNNYSPNDPLAAISHVFVGLSILLTYPICFIGFRDGVLEILQVPEENQTSNNLNALSFILLAFLTTTAVFVTDPGLIFAVGGGTLSTAIAFVFPTLMFRAAVRRKPNPPVQEEREIILAMALMSIGVSLGIIGVVVAIQKFTTTHCPRKNYDRCQQFEPWRRRKGSDGDM